MIASREGTRLWKTSPYVQRKASTDTCGQELSTTHRKVDGRPPPFGGGGRLVSRVTGPIFCTKWNVSVTPVSTFVRSRRRGCGDVGNVLCFPHLHAPVASAR